MNAPITLKGGDTLKAMYNPDEIIDFEKLLIPGTEALSHVYINAHVLVQSLNHFLVSITVYDYYVKKKTIIPFDVAEPFICFEIIQSPDVSILQNGKKFYETHEPCCRLTGYGSGQYGYMLPAGAHRITVVSINPEWIRQKSTVNHRLKDLLEVFDDHGCVWLAVCPFKNQIKRTIKLSLYQKNEDLTKKSLNVTTFLNQIFRSYQECLFGDVPLTSEVKRKKEKQLSDLIMQNLDKPLVNDTSAIARELLMSKKSLIRLVKESHNGGLKHYVINLKMSFAVKYLIKDRKKVTEVAQLMGYKDQFYFSRAFKKFWGVPPVEILNLGESLDSDFTLI